MKVLVTGATGIVGSNLVRALIGASHRVRVLVRPSSDLRSLQDLPIEVVEGDVLEPERVRAAARGCKVLFHAAAVFSYWSEDAASQEDLAVRGTRTVLEAAREAGVARVVVTSSSVVLGSTARRRVLDEANAIEETDPSAYTKSKIAQEKTAFEIGAALGLDVIAVCPTLVMGPYDFRLSPSNANIVNYLNDPFRSTFMGGCNIVSAADVAQGHLIAALRGQPGCRYVLGSENLTWQEVHGLISELTGTFGPSIVLNHTASYLAAMAAEVAALYSGRRPVVSRDEAKMSTRFYWYSHARMAELGYKPAAARQALGDAIAWLIARTYINDSVRERLKLAPPVRAALARFEKRMAA
ncbi:MAG: NAD-dependent epimerase/dehydratase family protein [Burkholderiaceae bacterium]